MRYLVVILETVEAYIKTNPNCVGNLSQETLLYNQLLAQINDLDTEKVQ